MQCDALLPVPKSYCSKGRLVAGLIPSWIITKTLKMVPIASLFGNQYSGWDLWLDYPLVTLLPIAPSWLGEIQRLILHSFKIVTIRAF